MLLNQKSNTTKYNRYPNIFKEIQSIINKPDKILSFGCSTGEECKTLSDIYFPDSKIVGLDINIDIIKNNINNNNNKNIEYFNNINNLNENYCKFNLIFAMSVLCSWPERDNNYTFDIFNSTINDIDKLLENNGYICIYNSKYLFTESDVFEEKYKIIETKNTDSGFVTKYEKNNNMKVFKYPYILFQKIKN